MKTKITELLGIEYPIIQGGMAWVAEHNLAAAVSEAGGLGIIGAGGAPADFVREQIRSVKEVTDRPFGVNIMLMNPEADAIAQVIVDEGVGVVTTGAGNPSKYMQMWKAAGVKVIPVVASVAMAKLMQRGGADAVVAEGIESGGHIGSLTTMALVPQVADAVAASESIVHENYKAMLIKAKDIDSAVTGMTTGHPVRSIRNKMTKEYLRLEKEGADFMELEKLTLGSLKKAVVEGDVVNGTVMAGQIAGLVRKEQPCREIITEIVEQGTALLNRTYQD